MAGNPLVEIPSNNSLPVTMHTADLQPPVFDWFLFGPR